MSICMGEEKALLGVEDIGLLASTVEEDANPEALGIGAEKGVDCIGELYRMKDSIQWRIDLHLPLGNKSDSKSAFPPVAFCLLTQWL